MWHSSFNFKLIITKSISKMKKLINAVIVVFLLVSYQGYSQCNVQTSSGSNGVTVKYLNSEVVGSGVGCELGVSISTNGTSYFFNTNVKYAKKSVKSGGPLVVVLNNNQSLSLKLYNCQISKVKKSENVSSVYFLTLPDVEKLKKASIQKIIFQEVGGKDQGVTLSKNFDVALRHLKCLESK